MIPASSNPAAFRIRLPATSANLGPGFDAAAVALNCFLEIEAELSDKWSIKAIGSDPEVCGSLDGNLILDTYNDLLRSQGRTQIPLALGVNNGIPLGMGLGSSAAGRLAAIALASHFGQLNWTSTRILEEVCALEGHPDNAAACWLGGFVMAACEPPDGSSSGSESPGRVHVAQVQPPADWRPILVLPHEPLATSKARAALPAAYSRADVVANIQSAGLLGLAFAQGRADLLRIAMADRIHQPYRAPICPLLEPILPLAGRHGIAGVALSGAGPAVLVIVESESAIPAASAAILAATAGGPPVELLHCRFENRGANANP